MMERAGQEAGGCSVTSGVMWSCRGAVLVWRPLCDFIVGSGAVSGLAGGQVRHRTGLSHQCFSLGTSVWLPHLGLFSVSVWN